ncbi:MAG TPA: phage holin family protein [Pyrinomonadaceae bacterium]|nr:phage holin family protein [Pyrinomonadaceae bacterium]
MAQELLTKDERSLGDLFSELAGETGTLVRQEIALAQVEISKKASSVGANVGSLAVGGAVAYGAFLAIMAGVIMGLAHFIPAWIAALLVGAIVGAAAYFMVSNALAKLRDTELTPTDTVDSIKEDAKWLKRQVS